MTDLPFDGLSPLEIARAALERLTELGLPPTPENYTAQYRALAGVGGEEPSTDSADPAQTAPSIHPLVDLIGDANNALHRQISTFQEEATGLLEQAANSHDPDALNDLFQALNASSAWLLTQVEMGRRDLALAREQINAAHEELTRERQRATTDGLTGLLNRRGIMVALSRELSGASRKALPLCLAVLDIDHFKPINDEFGHAVGDKALVHFAQVILSAVRDIDIFGRYGGEEFILILPHTDIASARLLLNRLLAKCAHAILPVEEHRLKIQFSAGLTQWKEAQTAQQLIECADSAMYQAKRNGRERVEIA